MTRGYLSFRKWLEDVGAVFNSTNDDSFASQGVGSRLVALDKKRPKRISQKIDRLFGKGRPAPTSVD